MPEVQESEAKLASGTGEVTQKEHDNLDMITRNRLANVSFFVCSIGEIVVLAILAGILQGIIREGDADSNTRALSVVCAYSAGVWSESTCSSGTASVHRGVGVEDCEGAEGWIRYAGEG